MDLSKFGPQIEKLNNKKTETMYRWPTRGRLYTYYTFWMLFNCLVNAMFIWSRIAFEANPHWYSVIFEYFMNFVYLFDMVRTFITPVIERDSEDRQIYHTKLKAIACYYFKTWFFVDLFCFFPVALLRSTSSWEAGSMNDW